MADFTEEEEEEEEAGAYFPSAHLPGAHLPGAHLPSPVMLQDCVQSAVNRATCTVFNVHRAVQWHRHCNFAP